MSATLMSFEIVHKPTFLNQLVALPKDRVVQVLKKIEILRADPSPREPVKVKIQDTKPPRYRLASGDFRVFYTYGNGWVCLLGVYDRKEAYRRELPEAQEPDFNIRELPRGDEWEQPTPATGTLHRAKATRQADEEFGRPVDDTLLERLCIPSEYRRALSGCRTLDELVAARVPKSIMEQMFDVLVDPDYDMVSQQPDYLTGDPSDLLRFVEGDLLGFLLRLDSDQEKYVDWAISGAGPTLVKGGPGSGKSMIALYRVRSLLKALQASGVPRPRILFTTYTRALTNFSEQLLRRLLGDECNLVEVRTADRVAKDLVDQNDGPQNVKYQDRIIPLLGDAIDHAVFEGSVQQRRAQASAVEHMTREYLLEEIASVIKARGLGSLDEYLAAPRAGRGLALNAAQRTAVWRVHESLSRIMRNQGIVSLQELHHRALQLVRSGSWTDQYDAVVIDEAQDLDPTLLRTLVALCRTPDRIFVTADANQSIYRSDFRWSDLHTDLRFQGRTGILRKNYRLTREIGEATLAYLRAGMPEEQPVEPAYAHDGGPLPAVRFVKGAREESKLLARFLHWAAREVRLGLGSCAVLVPTEKDGRTTADRLRESGIGAEFMKGTELDLEKPGVKVITLHAAKGLEFPVVAVAGFIDGALPGLSRRRPAYETKEELLKARRTMFVAMTRAMRALLVVLPANHTSPLFGGFEEPYWNLGGIL